MFRSAVLLFSVLWIVACSDKFEEAPEGAELNFDIADVTGRWQGLADTPVGEVRLEVEIQETPDGLKSVLRAPGTGAPDTPVDTTQFNRSSGEVYLKGAEGPFLSFSGTVGEDKQIMTGAASTLIGKIELTLSKNDPSLARFDHPRVDTDYAPVSSYSYATPADLADGWAIAQEAGPLVDVEQLSTSMTQLLTGELGRVEALLIARDGELVVEEYFYGNEQDKPHTIQSITKSVTSMLLGIAKDQGKIGGVDDPAYKYFSDYQDSLWVSNQYPITLRHMLTMSGAIDWNETLPYSSPDNSNTAMNATDDWIGYVLNRKRAGQPGLVSAYSSGQSILLGGVIKSATGEYADEFAKQTLFKDLGITNFNWIAAPDGTRHTGGGLSVTARDLLKLGELMRMGGQWQGKQVISSEWVQASSEDRLGVYGRPGREDWEYGYQWWIPNYTVNGETIEVIAGIGYGGQYLGIVPSLDTVFVLNAGEFTDAELRTLKLHEFVEKHVLPVITL